MCALVCASVYVGECQGCHNIRIFMSYVMENYVTTCHMS